VIEEKRAIETESLLP